MSQMKSAKKAMKQSENRRIRRRASSRYMKTIVRKLSNAVADGNKEQARALLPLVFSALDMSTKKNILHWRTAARKKSALSKLCQ